jgi:hypothetical protein
MTPIVRIARESDRPRQCEWTWQGPCGVGSHGERVREADHRCARQRNHEEDWHACECGERQSVM